MESCATFRTARRAPCQTAAQCAVTACLHWGRTEHRVCALRRTIDFLTESLHHHTHTHTQTGKGIGAKVGLQWEADRWEMRGRSHGAISFRPCEDKLLPTVASSRRGRARLPVMLARCRHTCYASPFSPWMIIGATPSGAMRHRRGLKWQHILLN